MKRILVAEDDRSLRMLIVESLEDLAGEVHQAEDGQEAYGLISSVDYDLVIIDNMMPGLTGLEVLGRVSPLKKKKTKIIMLSAKFDKKDQGYLAVDGVDLFLAKPFDPFELYGVVQEMLDEK